VLVCVHTQPTHSLSLCLSHTHSPSHPPAHSTTINDASRSVPFLFIFAFLYFVTILRENKRGGAAAKSSKKEAARPATTEEKAAAAASWAQPAFTQGSAKAVGKKRGNSKNKKKNN
jgi:hypothetical protein